jgi:hypothetical protein
LLLKGAYMKKKLRSNLLSALVWLAIMLASESVIAGIIDYEVKTEGKNVIIKLHKVYKENVAFVTIQRCASGYAFADIEQKSYEDLDLSGSYTFVDHAPSYGNNFYRIRIEDINGDVSYSEIKYTKNLSDGVKSYLYPNPANGSAVYLKIDACKISDQLKVTVYSKLGVKVKEHIVEPNSGIAGPVELDIIQELHPGIYYIQAESSNIFFREKLVINKG